MAEDTGILTDLSRRFAERQADFRETWEGVGERAEPGVNTVVGCMLMAWVTGLVDLVDGVCDPSRGGLHPGCDLG